MLEKRSTAWLRPLFILVAMAGALLLAGCGGGNGAPNNPYEPIPAALQVTPTAGTTAAHAPFSFTITGGSPPYFLFSSNPGVVSVPVSVAGPTLTLNANDVSASTAVTITVRDSASAAVTAGLTVTPNTTLSVQPQSADVFSGVPAALTVAGGVPPYTVFSSNASILPVPASVTALTVPLLANPVTATTPVTVTIQDRLGATATASLNVKPGLLLPASITVTGNPNCGTGNPAPVCSGQDGTASVTVTGVGGGGVSGRQIRFDVVLGAFSLVTTNQSTPAQSVTVPTDQNGVAAVTIRVGPNVPTQMATLRATDVASGSNVIAQFPIQLITNGNAVLSVIPSGTTTFTGPDTAHCASGGTAAFYIFGGTPPYSVQTNFPTAVTLSGVPVPASGNGFTISPTGVCFTGLTFAITDATGRTLQTPPTVDNVFGTGAPIVDLAIIPSEFPIGGGTTTCNNNTFPFLISGGAGKYSGSVSPGQGATGVAVAVVNEGAMNVTFTGAGHGDFNVNVTDGTQINSAVIHCSP